jgi:hypothetical protein
LRPSSTAAGFFFDFGFLSVIGYSSDAQPLKHPAREVKSVTGRKFNTGWTLPARRLP